MASSLSNDQARQLLLSRNGLFPLAYALLFVPNPPLLNDYRTAAIAGLLIALTG